MSAILTLEYEPRDTFFHKMTPLAKVVLYVFVMSLTFIWWDPIYLTVLCFACIGICWKAKLPRQMAKIIVTLFVLVSLSGVISHPAWLFQTDPSLFKRLPQDIVTRSIFVIHLSFGDLPITLGKVVYLYSVFLRYIPPMTMVLVFLYTVNPSDLVQMMIRFGFPNSLVFVVLAIFRFFSVFTRILTNIINAQGLRGWSLKTRNPIVLVRRATPLFAPLGRGFVTMIDIVNLSISNRGFELATKMAPLREYKSRVWEKTIIYGFPPLYLLLWYLTMVPPYYGNI
jgi:energy-coupling factor transport system permease protein